MTQLGTVIKNIILRKMTNTPLVLFILRKEYVFKLISLIQALFHSTILKQSQQSKQFRENNAK